MTSCNVARQLLMVQIEPWQNSTPIFGAAALCITKLDEQDNRDLSSSTDQEEVKNNTATAPSSSKKTKMSVEKASTARPDLEDCVISKGRCKKHEIEAKKNVGRLKKCGKVRDGWGWVHSCKVEWTCRMQIS